MQLFCKSWIILVNDNLGLKPTGNEKPTKQEKDRILVVKMQKVKHCNSGAQEWRALENNDLSLKEKT